MPRRLKNQIVLVLWIVLELFLGAGSDFARGDEGGSGRLLIIGGGTRRSSVEIYERLIEGAGGRERAQIGILPTASRSLTGSQKMVDTLLRFGLQPNQVEILDLTPFNAKERASDPQLVERVRRCTGIFIAGGDQRRVTAALIGPDGTDRPVLQAIRDVFRRGGIIAGSSAGAAVQSELMLAVSGLPADLTDEGFDALDFGLSEHAARRGLHVSPGLGFLQSGIIDQHFNQYRGRLGRLARAAIERQSRLAFGVDENTALDVGPQGEFEVVGTGSVVILNTVQAKASDGPLGCRLSQVIVSALQQGDRFNPQTGVATIHPGKREVVAGKEDLNGNYLIADMAGEGAINHALFTGLAENTSRTQVGVMLKHDGTFAHGYRFTFSKTAETRGYEGYVRDEFSNAILNVRLDVEPVVLGLQASATAVPRDVSGEKSAAELQAVWFRGLLATDASGHLRPEAAITRIELARALTRLIHLELPRKETQRPVDMDEALPEMEDVLKVLGAGLMSLDGQGRFAGEAIVSRRDAAGILVRACERYRGEKLPGAVQELEDSQEESPELQEAIYAAVEAGLLPVNGRRFDSERPVTRKEVAVALCRIIEFSWD
ncbi:MAG: cyanophycinase [Planctomycetes bacterium]|nr:cyanophycinase [Planctomycetota bacterium]